jgi:hypothetical protein
MFCIGFVSSRHGTIRNELACEQQEKHFVAKDNDANSVLNGTIIMYQPLVLHLHVPPLILPCHEQCRSDPRNSSSQGINITE